MGVTVNPNVGTYKIIKYIKVPDRRLFSGLLYINVVNHDENDDKDDFIQAMHEYDDGGTVPPSIAYSNMFTDPPAFHDRGRKNMRHSFADYDCFIFSVCGGMSLTGGVTSPASPPFTRIRGDNNGNSNPLVTNGYANYVAISDTYYWSKADGSNGDAFAGNDNSASWYVDGSGSDSEATGDPFGDSCCHFIKYHLLSRINNGSGHAQNTTGNEFYKHRPTLRKTWTQNVDGDINSSNPATVGTNDEWILSHGTYDTEEVNGDPLTKSELAIPALDTTVNDAYEKMDNDATADEGNTYFAPVDKISIYGTHHLRTDFHDQKDSVGTDRIWGQGVNAVHIDNFWSFVVEIGLRGNNPGGSSEHQPPDKALIKSNVLVSFQPFGETAAFVVSDTKHTS